MAAGVAPWRDAVSGWPPPDRPGHWGRNSCGRSGAGLRRHRGRCARSRALGVHRRRGPSAGHGRHRRRCCDLRAKTLLTSRRESPLEWLSLSPGKAPHASQRTTGVRLPDGELSSLWFACRMGSWTVNRVPDERCCLCGPPPRRMPSRARRSLVCLTSLLMTCPTRCEAICATTAAGPSMTQAASSASPACSRRQARGGDPVGCGRRRSPRSRPRRTAGQPCPGRVERGRRADRRSQDARSVRRLCALRRDACLLAASRVHSARDHRSVSRLAAWLSGGDPRRRTRPDAVARSPGPADPSSNVTLAGHGGKCAERRGARLRPATVAL